MSEFGRMLDEAQERIQALEQQNAALERERDGLTWAVRELRSLNVTPGITLGIVQKLVEAARAVEPYCQCPIPALNQALAEALKPFPPEEPR